MRWEAFQKSVNQFFDKAYKMAKDWFMDSQTGKLEYHHLAWFLMGILFILIAAVKTVWLSSLILGLGLTFIGLPYFLIRTAVSSGKRTNYAIKAGTTLLLIFVCFVTGIISHMATPEYQAQEAARAEQRKIELQQQKEEAAAKAEQDAKDAELQKKYDDQKKYEEWLDWQKKQEQKKYDDQEKYEKYVAWQKQKEEQAAAKAAKAAAQKPYDDQKKYEDWLAWQQNTLKSAVNVDSISISETGNGSYNVDIKDKAVLRTSNDVVTYGTRDEVTLKKANMLNQCMEIVQKLQATNVPINYITITLTGKTQDINGYIYDNDDIAVCEINGNAKFSSFEGFQNSLRRFATIEL